MKRVTIGSRGSDLALWQANHVKRQLVEIGCDVEIKIIKTRGDQIQHLSFDKMEGKGFFTKEIEDALLKKDIDLAVHSHKDLETESPEGLTIACVSERENPADLLLVRIESVSKEHKFEVKENAVVGTSSARRKTQLLHHRPDVTINDLRGNVPTRIDKLRSGNYDAIILAKAGVDRLQLDLSDLHVYTFNPKEFVPAPAQGVLGLQIREEDHSLAEVLNKINHEDVQKRIKIERKVLNLMDGGCQLPLGVYCTEESEVFVAIGTTDLQNCNYFRYNNDGDPNLANTIVQELKGINA